MGVKCTVGGVALIFAALAQRLSALPLALALAFALALTLALIFAISLLRFPLPFHLGLHWPLFALGLPLLKLSSVAGGLGAWGPRCELIC